MYSSMAAAGWRPQALPHPGTQKQGSCWQVSPQGRDMQPGQPPALVPTEALTGPWQPCLLGQQPPLVLARLYIMHSKGTVGGRGPAFHSYSQSHTLSSYQGPWTPELCFPPVPSSLSQVPLTRWLLGACFSLLGSVICPLVAEGPLLQRSSWLGAGSPGQCPHCVCVAKHRYPQQHSLIILAAVD